MNKRQRKKKLKKYFDPMKDSSNTITVANVIKMLEKFQESSNGRMVGFEPTHQGPNPCS